MRAANVTVRRAPVNCNAFSVFLFPERKKFDRNRNRRKVAKNRRIVVFRVEHIENMIARLGTMGIQADLILFHPYDRWGYSRMNLEQQNFYLRYVVNRFSAYHNVWWAMANEFDLFRWKPVSEWESNAETVCRQDPYRHLRSIHNCMTMYDHSRGWITHCSLQRIDLYRTAENVEIWRP